MVSVGYVVEPQSVLLATLEAAKLYTPLFVCIGLIGLINLIFLDGALTDWISNRAEQQWFWGIWVLVWLIYVIGDKLLKATSSASQDVLLKLNEINESLDRVREEIEWAGRNNGRTPIEKASKEEKIKREIDRNSDAGEIQDLIKKREKSLSRNSFLWFMFLIICVGCLIALAVNSR